MRFFVNALDILKRKDIHWLELLILWITACFFVTLLAPGNYFASRPSLHRMENTIFGIYLSERFWSTIFGGLLAVQVFGIVAGEEAIKFSVTRTKRFALSPYLVRMRGLGISVGVWSSVGVLTYEGGQAWPLHLFWLFPVVFHVSLIFGLCLGLGVFSFAGAVRMAAEVSLQRQRERRALTEAEQYVQVFQEVEIIRRDVESIRLKDAGMNKQPQSASGQ